MASPLPPAKTAVLVLGMHRSGTSALTRIIGLLGADLPTHLIPASATSNPSGHWESRDVQELNDRILAALNSRWDDEGGLETDRLSGELLEDASRRALDILNKEFKQSNLFVLKDPRICRLLPFWLSALKQFGAAARCVLIWRDPIAVAASLSRRNRFPLEKSQRLWLRYVLDAERDSRDQQRTIVSYDELTTDWRSAIRRVAQELNIVWPQAGANREIDEFIQTSSANAPDAAGAGALSKHTSNVVKLLRIARSQVEFEATSRQFSCIRQEIDQTESSELRRSLRVGRQYIHDLENAARIRDTQISEGAVRLDEADTRISQLNKQLRDCYSTGEPEGEPLRAAHLLLLQQRRALLQSQRWSILRAPLLSRGLSAHERLDLFRQARALLRTGLLDPVWYLESAPDVLAAGVNPVWHWLTAGWREGRSPNPLFDTGWYLSTYPDAAASGLNPLVYYLRYGSANGHSPGPLFDRAWYLDRNADVRAAGIDPAVHWLNHGAREGRCPGPWFDPAWYMSENPDVAAAGLPALEHYLAAGGREGRDPSRFFSSRWYLAQYKDVRSNPLIHFLKHGIHEFRRPHPPAGTYRPDQAADGIFDPLSSLSVELEVSEPLAVYARAATGAAGIGRFSVIMPTWNRRESLAAAIDSVIAQSYVDWELIVCDDGSTDGSIEAIRTRYANIITVGRLRILALPHRGVSAARNAGLQAASGTWIAYLDSDNTWHPHYLLMMSAAYAEHPQRHTAYACLRVHDEVKNAEYVRYNPFHYGKLLAHNYIDLNVFTHRRSLYEQLGGFDEQLRRLVDWDLILRYVRTYEPVQLPQVLCDYRIATPLGNISLTEALGDNERRVRRKHARQVAATGAAPLRLACVTPIWPASMAAQALIESLRRSAVDVRVYCLEQGAPSDPSVVPVTVTRNAEELSQALTADQRNWVHGLESSVRTIEAITDAAEQSIIAYSFETLPAHAIENDRASLNHAAASELHAPMPVIEIAPQDVSSKELELTNLSVQALLDNCARPPLDIFTVIHLRDGDAVGAATAERAIRSALAHTTTPMVFTVILDGSSPFALQRLASIAHIDGRIRLIPLSEPQGFARCANLALSMSHADYVAHVSSTGCHVVRPGWEQHCLKTMRMHPSHAIAGALNVASGVLNRRALKRQSWFTHCREAGFAWRWADRPLRHVHPGLFVLRRAVFEREGGFNENIPAPSCLIEYGHFIESRGHSVGHIHNVHVLPSDCDASLDPCLDESVLALDGACASALALVAKFSQPGFGRCNVCGWHGEPKRHEDNVGFDCPKCGSAPRDRAALRWLAGADLALRRPTLDARGLGAAVRHRLESMFPMQAGPSQIGIPTPVPGASSLVLGLAPDMVTGDAASTYFVDATQPTAR